MKDVIENNKLIAEFMMFETVGDLHLIPFDNTANDTYLPEHMKFHSSWDWLMPVIDKIEDTENKGFMFGVCGNEARVHSTKNARTIIIANKDTRLNSTYTAVVEFIKWYNENK